MRAVSPKKAKPLSGHRCGKMIQWVSLRCECGWTSDILRRNETAAVYEYWRQHRAACEQGASSKIQAKPKQWASKLQAQSRQDL